jgi:pimeloyl-ACP methyl ester carboxylesterase
MRKAAVGALILVVVILLLVALLPYLSNKENITCEEAASRWAKGKFVTVDSKKVHYLEQGEGKPVILIHGFLYHTVMWKQNLKTILIVHGREDRAIPLDRSQKLHALWKGSQLVVFEEAGHTPQEEHPEQFNQLALEFLSG